MEWARVGVEAGYAEWAGGSLLNPRYSVVKSVDRAWNVTLTDGTRFSRAGQRFGDKGKAHGVVYVMPAATLRERLLTQGV